MKKIFIALITVISISVMFMGTGCSKKEEVFQIDQQASIEVGSQKVLTLINTTKEKDVKWQSSNVSVVTVSNGTITGVSAGTANITANTENYSSVCIVIITNDFVISATEKNVELGEVFTLSIRTDKTEAIEWKVSDETILSKNTQGKTATLTAIKTGSAQVTATLGDKSAVCKVTVVTPDNPTGGIIPIAPVNGEIHTAAEFAGISKNMSGKYKLMNDIDFTDLKLDPIGAWDGAASTTFTGSLDGQGYALLNLKINEIQDNAGEIWGAAIIKTVGSKGIVKNLNVIDITVSGHGFSAGIIGKNEGTIMNCFVKPKQIISVKGLEWNVYGGCLTAINTTSGIIDSCLVYYNDALWHNTFLLASWNWGVIRNSFAVDTTVREAANVITLISKSDDKNASPGSLVQPVYSHLLSIAEGKKASSFTDISTKEEWVITDGALPYLKTTEGTVRNWGN